MIKVVHGINRDGLVKFQLFNAEEDKGKPHYDWVKSHELTFDQAKELFDYGASIGQEVFFSVFGVKYVEWCEQIGVAFYKIPCCLHDDIQLFDKLWHTGKIIISSYDGEGILSMFRIPHYSLYCPPGYPQTSIPYPAMLQKGFSDHTIGIGHAKAAIFAHAKIVEKHFVLNHDSQFPDNDWSMTPKDLKELVLFEKVCKEVI